jgi:hypothetical protein
MEPTLIPMPRARPKDDVAETPRAARLAQGLFVALAVLAAVLLSATLLTSLHDVSTAWDVWYYHLPFAARLAGIVPEGAYVFHPVNQARFEGFPLLGELLQGLLWRAFGAPQASNLLAFAAVPCLALFLRRRFQVPAAVTVVALFAVPLVQLHASSCYVDLPANAALTMLLFTVFEAWTLPHPVTSRRLAAMLALAAFAANMRLQLLVPVALALLAAAPRVLGALPSRLASHGGRTRLAWGRFFAGTAALPVVFATPLKNLVLHGNPFFPMRLALGPVVLRGTEDIYRSSPPYLERAPQALRFAFSLLEIGIRPLEDPRRWSIDQWMPADSTGNRMGGFFGAYVAFHLALLVLLARRREARPAALAFAALTAVTALLPQSHELRYYLYWMLTLVSLNLVLVCRRARTEDTDRDPGARLYSALIGAAGAVALAVVLAVTRMIYVYPSGDTLPELIASKVSAETIARIRDGDRMCLQGREPWTFLYAAKFHPGRSYGVLEAERPEDCGDLRPSE